MNRLKQHSGIVAPVLVMMLTGLGASVAASGVDGISASPALAVVERGTGVAYPSRLATPAAMVMAFLAGYVAYELSGCGMPMRAVPAGIDDRIFDFPDAAR
jgi:hypothetical protein